MDAEVIVVGGGPAGSCTAALLAAAGYEVLVLDRARFPRDKACAEYLSPATVDAFARLGVLAAIERWAPERPRGMRLIVGWQTGVLLDYPDGAGRRHALCLERRVLDTTLLDHARTQGAQVLEGWQVSDVEAAADTVRIGARPVAEPRSRQRELSARLIIAADGARSAVAASLGLRRTLRWPRRAGFIARYRGAAGAAALREAGEMHVGRGLYCGLAPLPGGRVNVGLVMDLSAARRAGSASAAFAAGLARLPGAAGRLRGGYREGRLQGAAPLAVRAARVYGDGFLLAGDAAGFLDPFTGEGIFRAVRSAELAAEVAAQALGQDACSADRLAPYAALRHREFAAKEALCWLIQGLLAWPPLLAYALRRLAARPAAHAVLGGVLGDYRPAAEALHPALLWSLLKP